MNKVLIISTEYPPASRSSGVQRIVNFTRYLPDDGWDPYILTMHSRAYGTELDLKTTENLSDNVKRSMAFNAAIHFSIKGRYFSWMALPDRWSSWVLFGFFSGLRFIKKNKPTIIVASYPHPSALLLALLLHKATGLPLVADFRDPMLYLNHSIKGARKKVYQWIERHVVRSCRYATFTTASAIDKYIKIKYPCFESKYRLIENGFDEKDFIEAENKLQSIKAVKKNKFVLLHSGGIFPDERNPTHFFEALSILKDQGEIKPTNFKVMLRAPGDKDFCLSMIQRFGLDDIVFVYPKINYLDALVEMLSVDGLLVLQGSSCNFQVPAKIYEYFRAKRPILALTDKKGETAKLMQVAGINSIASLDNTVDIIKHTKRFIQQCQSGEEFVPTNDFISQQSRRSRTHQLAELLYSI